MGKIHIGAMPDPIKGGDLLVSDEIGVDTGTVHQTIVITPEGEVQNPHVTFTPDNGPKARIWPEK